MTDGAKLHAVFSQQWYLFGLMYLHTHACFVRDSLHDLICSVKGEVLARRLSNMHNTGSMVDCLMISVIVENTKIFRL